MYQWLPLITVADTVLIKNHILKNLLSISEIGIHNLSEIRFHLNITLLYTQ